MTGVLAGSGGTGVLEGSRPGTGVEGGGGVSAYDAAILTMGPMWYSTVSSTAPILFWPTLAEVRDGDLGDEIERGRLWFAAWWNESGNAPVTYIATADDFGPALMWYSPVDEFDPIVWPTLIEVLDGDLAAVEGVDWFAAWFTESGYAPATYELDIAETGPMWFSRLAELDAIVSWPTLDEVITGDLGSESDNGRLWMAAWFSDSGNAPATYDLDVNETGPIWYSTIDELNAIATWPTLATVITSDLGAESENGHWWFAAWFLEAGQAPATYRGDIDETGPMWFSPLDALVPLAQPVQFVSQATTTYGSGSIALPTFADGDVAVFCAINNSTTPTVVGSGASHLARLVLDQGASDVWVLPLQTGDTAITHSTVAYGMVLVFRGVDTSSPVAASGTNGGGVGASSDVGVDLTATGDGQMNVQFTTFVDGGAVDVPFNDTEAKGWAQYAWNESAGVDGIITGAYLAVDDASVDGADLTHSFLLYNGGLILQPPASA
jgi:hypothetical protein